MFSLEFKVLPHLDNSIYQPLCNQFKQISCQASVSQFRPTGALARFDWLLPCGVTMELTEPFYETQLDPVRESFVAPLKQLIETELYQKMIRAQDPFQLRNKDGSVKSTIFSMHCCLNYTMRSKNDEMNLRLMFPVNCTPLYFREAIFSFMQMLEDVHLASSTELFLEMLRNADGQGFGTRVLWYNAETGRTEFVDVERSQKSNAVVKKRIA
ncbi:hypothetical protein K6Y31_15960 [Motilimonas cestriensis]|uniref:Uncharacterized protein n=1 Tax=Motilimonas cestriensis TaxID=2742685 RepID=A0ABS8WDA1_9GAMM|nr:hypothetical protein [Motilimonas cestriensis]MCE2596297.1 hypothetical protein [Motilimonas cestriensis]